MIPSIFKITTIICVLTLSLSSFGQTQAKSTHPDITVEQQEDGSTQRIYHFSKHTKYAIIRKGDHFNLLEGQDYEVDITSLVPGVYFIQMQDNEGNSIIDRFTVDWE